MKQRRMTVARLTVMGVAALVLAACSREAPQPPAPAAQISVIPAPRKVETGTGAFILSGNTRMEFGDGVDGERLGRYFTDLLQQTYGIGLGAQGNAPDGNAIRFELTAGDGTASPAAPAHPCAPGQLLHVHMPAALGHPARHIRASCPSEGYRLVSSPERVVISATDSRGLFYGAVTLWQLLSKQAEGFVVPAVTIEDSPRFGWRGLMLDSTRHFQPPEFIRKFIDVMALHKLNVLHWHLTDDQAWRLEIKKYPRLTEVGAWRVPAGAAPAADIDPVTGKPRLYGGFYSQQDVRDIVAYAMSRNITIVPEIDVPGHASAAIAAYPKLGVLDKPSTQVPADWGVYPNLFNVEESTFQFLEDVLAEVVTLFPGQYIHVGGDEAVKDQWQASRRVQARMKELGAKDEHEMQSYFIKRMEKFLSSKGRRLIGWDEILEGGLPQNATVMSWRGIDGAVAAAAAGHDTVLSPQPTLYFDRRPYDAPTSPGRVEVVTVEQVYAFDPAPAAIREEQRKHILGVQANIWVEHIRTLDRVEYMTFPRAAALAEVAWSVEKDWAGFSARLPAQLDRYKALDVRFAEQPLPRPLDARWRISHELALCTNKIPLSLEDDAPLSGDRAVFKVDILEPCWLFKGADLSKVSSLVASVGQVPFNFQVGNEVKSIPLRAPATAAGELEVRVDDCNGERIAVLPLAAAAGNNAVTKLPAASIKPREGTHDLCFTFTRKSVDPIWVIDSIELQSDTAGTE